MSIAPSNIRALKNQLLGQGERLFISPLLRELGVRHGFTTRLGGVSTGRYESLNLGSAWGDDPARVAENLRLVAEQGGFPPEALCQVAQVHGTAVVAVDAVEQRARQADGMATDKALTLGVNSADCVCILLADGAGRVAAVHAGWRGTVSGIAAQAVEALVKLGATPESLRAVSGPSIGPCCFEVQQDVAQRFSALAKETVSRRYDSVAQRERLYVDLHRANRIWLTSAGVRHIADDPPCTHCDPRHFFSYRRDGAGIGQHLAFIVGGGS